MPSKRINNVTINSPTPIVGKPGCPIAAAHFPCTTFAYYYYYLRRRRWRPMYVYIYLYIHTRLSRCGEIRAPGTPLWFPRLPIQYIIIITVLVHVGTKMSAEYPPNLISERVCWNFVSTNWLTQTTVLYRSLVAVSVIKQTDASPAPRNRILLKSTDEKETVESIVFQTRAMSEIRRVMVL